MDFCFVLFCFKVVLSWKLDFSQLFNMSFCATGLVTGTARMKKDNLMNMLQITLLKQECLDLNVGVASLLESKQPSSQLVLALSS